MSWWGKLLGGAFGFMLGGPLGAMLGAAIGHNLDRGIQGIDVGYGRAHVGNTERVQSAFFTATFSVMGHLAKADGRVSEDEISLARQIMMRMQLNSEQEKIAIRLFKEGRKEGFNLNAILEQFRFECHGRRNLIQMFIEMQIAMALADSHVQANEKKMLLHIGASLGFAPHVIEQLITMAQAQVNFESGSRGRAAHKSSLSDAYAVLGVKKTTSDADLKKAYRRLMNQHHPDKLVAKGLPEEMMKLATEKTQEIKLAYEQIKEARG